MKTEDIRNDETPDETDAAEELATDEPYTDEERAAMPPEQRAEVERIEQAVEEFLSGTQRHMQTDKNRKAILGFLNEHDLRITPTSLLLAFEELSEAGELELKEDQPDESEEPEEESAKPAEEAEPAPRHRSRHKRSASWAGETAKKSKKSKLEPDMGKRAVFKDQHGHTYSAPVVLNDGQWVMVTSEGFAPITQFFDDDFAGRLEFVEYREEPDERLHIEAKQPGQSSLQQLQSAYAKTEAKARADRNRNVQAQVRQSNELDARRIQGARDNNNLLAQRWSRQRPDPVPPQIPPREVMAEAARFRKRTEQK